MGKTVSEVIEKLEKNNLKFKEETLLDMGLYEKVYSMEDNIDYPYSEFKDGKEVYFKKNPLPIGDEEWKKIIQLIQEKNILSQIAVKPKDAGNNTSIAGFMFTLVFISIFGGFFAGSYLLGRRGGDQVGILLIVISFVSGFIFLGLGEILRLVNDKKNK